VASNGNGIIQVEQLKEIVKIDSEIDRLEELIEELKREVKLLKRLLLVSALLNVVIPLVIVLFVLFGLGGHGAAVAQGAQVVNDVVHVGK